MMIQTFRCDGEGPIWDNEPNSGDGHVAGYKTKLFWITYERDWDIRMSYLVKNPDGPDI